MLLLPFDAHNHVHMGPTSIQQTSLLISASSSDSQISHHPHSSSLPLALSGMAVMSTHPRDYPIVLTLHRKHPSILPCFGVHPWWLHELTSQDWNTCRSNSRNRSTGTSSSSSSSSSRSRSSSWSDRGDGDGDGGGDDVNGGRNDVLPQWIHDLEQLLIQHPYAPVGEIGLDNFHFDPLTKALTTPVDIQVKAFQYQMALAIKHQRSVSVHCVQAFGKILDVLLHIRLQHKRLPPKIYFHAFGGKAPTVTQWIKALEEHTDTGKGKNKGKNNNVHTAMVTATGASDAPTPDAASTKLYFGFAPVINFQAKKTIDVIRAVGIDRIVLETDHEDAALVMDSMHTAIQVIADALHVTKQVLISKTNQNVRDLYGLDDNLFALDVDNKI